jgi:hypothetical protein
MVMGNIDALLAAEPPTVVAGADDGIRVIGLGLAGRRDEARARLRQMQPSAIGTFKYWTDYLSAWIERRTADMGAGIATFAMLKIQDDPEAIFQEGWMLCDVGEHEAGLARLKRAVAKGYFAASTLVASRQFDKLRSTPGFQVLVAEAAAGRDRALQAFRDGGGERLLGR